MAFINLLLLNWLLLVVVGDLFIYPLKICFKIISYFHIQTEWTQGFDWKILCEWSFGVWDSASKRGKQQTEVKILNGIPQYTIMVSGQLNELYMT